MQISVANSINPFWKRQRCLGLPRATLSVHISTHSWSYNSNQDVLSNCYKNDIDHWFYRIFSLFIYLIFFHLRVALDTLAALLKSGKMPPWMILTKKNNINIIHQIRREQYIYIASRKRNPNYMICVWLYSHNSFAHFYHNKKNKK